MIRIGDNAYFKTGTAGGMSLQLDHCSVCYATYDWQKDHAGSPSIRAAVVYGTADDSGHFIPFDNNKAIPAYVNNDSMDEWEALALSLPSMGRNPLETGLYMVEQILVGLKRFGDGAVVVLESD